MMVRNLNRALSLVAIALSALTSAGCGGAAAAAVAAAGGGDNSPPPPAPTAVIELVDDRSYPGFPVALSGRSSRSNIDDSTLSFAWSMTGPGGVTLSSTTNVDVQFTPVATGAHTVSLEVTSANGTDTETRTVVVREYVEPRLFESIPDHMAVGRTAAFGVIYSHTSSEPFTVSVSVDSRPAGSTAEVVKTGEDIYAFTPDAAGTFELRLIADDGLSIVDLAEQVDVVVDSEPTAEIRGIPPHFYAEAPYIGDELVGYVGGLPISMTSEDSADSDFANLGDTIESRKWTLLTRPAGSAIELSDVPNPFGPPVAATFEPDVAGIYEIELVVTSEGLESSPVTQRVHVFEPAYAFVELGDFGTAGVELGTAGAAIDIGAGGKRLVYVAEHGGNPFIERAAIDDAGNVTVERSEPALLHDIIWASRILVGDFVPGGNDEVALISNQRIYLFDSDLTYIDDIAAPYGTYEVHDVLGLGRVQLVGRPLTGADIPIFHFDGVELVDTVLPLPVAGQFTDGFYRRDGATRAGVRAPASGDTGLYEYDGVSWNLVETVPRAAETHWTPAFMNHDNDTFGFGIQSGVHTDPSRETQLVSFWPGDETRIGSIGPVQGSPAASIPADASRSQRLVFAGKESLTLVPVDADLISGEAELYQWPQKKDVYTRAFIVFGDFTGDGVEDIVRIARFERMLLRGLP